MPASEQPTSDPVFVRRLRVCPFCGAQTPAHLPLCWVCHGNLRKADARPLKTSQFSLGTTLLVMVLVAVVLTAFRLSTTAGIVLLAIVTPATARTIHTADLWKANRDRMPLVELLDTFLGSLGVSLAAWTFGLAAFVLAGMCILLAGPWLLPLPAICGVATAAYCFWKMWPVE